MVGDVDAFYGLIGENEGFRNVAGKACEDIVDLRHLFGRVLAKAVECAAYALCSVDNGSAAELVCGKRFDLGSAGVSVHIARDDDGKTLLGEVSDNVKSTELSCLGALMVEVSIEEDEELFGIVILESCGGIFSGNRSGQPHSAILEREE